MANAANLINFGSSGGGGLRLLDRQVFTSSGTWTKPADGAGNILAGTNKIVFSRAIGGGGGGLRSPDPAGQGTVFRAGGSGGGLSENTFDVAQITATVTVTIGAAGAANLSGADLNAVAGAGGNSSFGSFTWAGGGSGGYIINSGYEYDSNYIMHISEQGAWDVIRTQLTSLGGQGSVARGNRGAFQWALYKNGSSVYRSNPTPAEQGPGCGGGSSYGAGGPSSSGYIPVGSSSTTLLGFPGPGGNEAAGGSYGGGGGVSYNNAFAGAAGVVVVEVYG